MMKYCPECGSKTLVGAKFCKDCGFSLIGSGLSRKNLEKVVREVKKIKKIPEMIM